MGLIKKAQEVADAIRSINRSKDHIVIIDGDEEPCYWQRDEWIKWMLELADELESEIAKARE